MAGQIQMPFGMEVASGIVTICASEVVIPHGKGANNLTMSYRSVSITYVATVKAY